ncbi:MULTISPECIES: DMT family transporter [Collinsella]|nr:MULTISPECIES: DMT family transporter [Collinsella]
MALFILLVGRPVLRVSRLIALVAVCNFVTGTTFNFANQLTTVGNAIVLQYTSMIFVIVYQSLATHTLPSPAKIASVVVAFTGMGLFFLGDLSPEGMLGNLLAIISGAAFGLCFFLNSRPDASPMVSSLISCGISMLPIVYFAGALDSVRPFEWGLMLVHGLFCSGLASVLYAKGIARTNAFAANLVCMSEVVLAPCWSALLFGEVFHWNEFLGAAIIVLVIVANLASDAFGDGFLVALVRHRNKERA